MSETGTVVIPPVTTQQGAELDTAINANNTPAIPFDQKLKNSVDSLIKSKKAEEAAETATQPEQSPETEVAETEPLNPDNQPDNKTKKAKKAEKTPEVTTESSEKEQPVTKKASKAKFWEDKQAESQPATEVTPTAIPKDVQDELEILRSIINKPGVKAVLEAEKSGKNFIDYIDEVRGQDPSRLSASELYALRLKESGKDDTTIARLVEQFEEKDEIDQEMLVEEYRARKTGEYNDSLNKLNPDVMAEAKKQRDHVRKTYDDYSQMINSISGKEYDKLGITITPERARELIDFYNKPNSALLGVREDGTIDPADLLEFTAFKLYKKLIFNNIYDNGYKEGFESLEKEVTQPTGALAATSVTMPIPGRDAPQDEFAKRVEGLKKSLPGGMK